MSVAGAVLTKRIFPLFLLKGARLVKGTCFGDFKDVGDPVSQGMIFDAQGADEIAIVDVEASRQDRLIDTALIQRMIDSCKLPIAVGGGIRSVKDAQACFNAGADKIILNTQAVLNPALVKELAAEFGAQAVLASVDVRRAPDGRYEVYVLSGTRKIDQPFDAVIDTLVAAGIGELMVTAIDREGTLQGFDIGMYRALRSRVNVPLIASGGAGNYDHLVELFRQADCDACALGKMVSLRDYDIVRIKSYLTGRKVPVRDA